MGSSSELITSTIAIHQPLATIATSGTVADTALLLSPNIAHYSLQLLTTTATAITTLTISSMLQISTTYYV